MNNERTFEIKFKKHPKAFKEYVKKHFEYKNRYEAKEANTIYNEAVKKGYITGRMIVVMECLASGRVVCDVGIEIDPKLPLDVTLMNRIRKGMADGVIKEEQAELLVEDFKHAFGWEKHQEPTKKLDKEIEPIPKKQEVTIIESSEDVYEEVVGLLSDGVNELGEVDDYEMETDNIGLEFEDDDLDLELELGIAFEKGEKDKRTSNELLDVSTLNSIAELEKKVKQQNQNLKNPLNYLEEIFELQGGSDFVSAKKAEYVEKNFVALTTSFLRELYDCCSRELEQAKKRAKNQLDVEYCEIQSENYIKLEEQMSAIEETLRLHFDEKKTNEIAKIEKMVETEFEEQLLSKREEVAGELFANLNDEQREELNNCRALVENEVKTGIRDLIDRNEIKQQSFIEDLRARLQSKQFDFEREYNNLEMQKMRQEMLEERKRFQQQILEMQQMQIEIAQKNEENQVVINDESDGRTRFSFSKILFMVTILTIVIGAFFILRPEIISMLEQGF